MNYKELKKQLPGAETSLRERAKLDRKKVKLKKSPRIDTKYSAYIPSMRMTVFAERKKKLYHILSGLQVQYGFDINEIKFNN